MVNYAILTMDPPHLPPDTLQTHGEHGKQLSCIVQMGFISQRRGISEYTRMGWCPRTGGGQRLMSKTVVNEDIVLATCQDKYSL